MYKLIKRGFSPIIFLNIFESEFFILRTSLQTWFSFVTFVSRPLSIPRFCDIGRACFIYMLILHTHFFCFIWRPFTILSIKNLAQKSHEFFNVEMSIAGVSVGKALSYRRKDRISRCWECPWSGVILQTIGSNLQVLGVSVGQVLSYRG